MSTGFAPNIQPNAPKPGWSTGKKWLVGCGGCLGLIVIIVIALGILAGMGVSQLQKMSGESVSEIFGSNYKPTEYTALGIPLQTQKLKQVAMLINAQKGLVVFAAKATLTDKEFTELRNETGQQDFLKSIEALAKSNQQNGQNGKVKSMRLDKLYNHKIGPLKQFIVGNATLTLEKKDGSTSYSPISAAIIPETDNNLVVLAALNGQAQSSDPAAKFETEQKNLEEEVFKIIQDSELDDRVSLWVAPGKPDPVKPATPPAKATAKK